MKSERPTIRCIIEKSKKRKDGLFPLYILVTWKFKRAKESTGIYLSEKDFKKESFKTVKTLTKRLFDLETRVNELLLDGRDFTPSDVLSVSICKKPQVIISELCRIKKLAPKTVEGYFSTLKVLKFYFGDFYLNELTLSKIQGFARTIRVAPSTMAFYLKNLKSTLNFAVERGYIKENVMQNWSHKRDGYKDREKPRSRSKFEISEFVKIWKSKREECIGIWLSGYYFNGLALTDLISVNWSKIYPRFIEDGEFYSFIIERKKTKEVAHIMCPVTPLTKDLKEFLSSEPWKKHRFYSQYINLKLKKIDPTLTYYQCRHSFASLLVSTRTPLNTIASMLGRSVNGLSTYIHRVTEDETLAAASKALIDDEVVVSLEDEIEVFEKLVE